MDAPVSLESPQCPVCGHDDYVTVLTDARDQIWRKPGTFRLQRCRQCDLVATRPRPTPDALSFYYEGTYSGESLEGMRRFQTESWFGGLVHRYRLAIVNRVRRLTTDDHVLDVGCSYGGFLRTARSRSGCRTSGIDLDAGTIAQAVDADVTDYRNGRLVDVDFDLGAFSVITFFQSLEHHSEPVAALRRARALLKPGGHVVVEVPNYGGFWRRVFRTAWLPLLIPQHLFHFTPKTLRNTLAAAGFTHVRRAQTMFYPLEGTASLGIWLARLLRTPKFGTPPSWRTPFDLLVGLCLLTVYFVTEWPSQAVLHLCGAAGHQIIVAERDAPESEAVESPG